MIYKSKELNSFKDDLDLNILGYFNELTFKDNTIPFQEWESSDSNNIMFIDLFFESINFYI